MISHSIPARVYAIHHRRCHGSFLRLPPHLVLEYEQVKVESRLPHWVVRAIGVLWIRGRFGYSLAIPCPRDDPAKEGVLKVPGDLRCPMVAVPVVVEDTYFRIPDEFPFDLSLSDVSPC
jgi:hypothetical protein